MDNRPPLGRVLDPKSVAIVGASDTGLFGVNSDSYDSNLRSPRCCEHENAEQRLGIDVQVLKLERNTGFK